MTPLDESAPCQPYRALYSAQLLSLRAIVNDQLLASVLSSPRLPSPPGVALRVLQLTGDADVTMRELAETVQHDQALTTHVLRIVNSPLFGLGRPCTTLHQAQLMLGLNGLRTIVLGFSLVADLPRESRDGFDYAKHWRRAIYAACAAQAAAQRLGSVNREEAFIVGLIQDIGVVALHRVLGRSYAELVRGCHDDDQVLRDREQAALGLTHDDISAALLESWRVPEPLVEPVRCHHNPEDADPSHLPTARCSAFGALAADTLLAEDSASALDRLRHAARAWFALSSDADCDTLLREAADASAEASAVLQLPSGVAPDVDELLESANARLVSLSLSASIHAERTIHSNEHLQRAIRSDPITGAASVAAFSNELEEAFARARAVGSPLSLAFVDLLNLNEVNARHGWPVGDQALGAFHRLLKRHAGPIRAFIARTGGARFALLMERVQRSTAREMLERLCQEARSAPLALDGAPALPALQVSTAIGMATFETATAADIASADALATAADSALKAAQVAGGDCVRLHQPRRNHAA